VRHFFIDGYNLLFIWSEENQPLEVRRGHLIAWIQQVFAKINCKGMIVFDGSRRSDEDYGLSYSSPMEVAYTPKGQTADQYILDQIEQIKDKKAVIVVTNDLMLKRHIHALSAKTMSSTAFLQWVSKQKQKKKSGKPVIRESTSQIERWLKIFEERLKIDLDE